MRAYRRHGVLVVLIGVLAIASPRSSVAQQPIQLGASISITGRDAIQGGYVHEGYLLCQKHVNGKGGVLGRPVQFAIRDDGSGAQAGIRIYEKLITEDKVDAVMGPYGSSITDAVADVTEKHRKLMVAPTAATTAIWEKGRRYVVMVPSPLEASTEGTIDLAAGNGLKTIAVVGSLARPAIAKGAVGGASRMGTSHFRARFLTQLWTWLAISRRAVRLTR
jgi:branched-chain amino acid transport system substrate-binding protein